MIKKIFSFIISAVMAFSIILNAEAAAGDVNLALGKGYTITQESPIENAYPEYIYNDSAKKLTDGKKASSANINSQEWLKIYRGTFAVITVDLGKVNAVSEVRIRQLNNRDAGVWAARYIYIGVSEDGKSFGTVAEKTDPSTILSARAEIITHIIDLKDYYKARYVRITISSDVHLYTDEVEIYGKADVSAAKTAKTDQPREYQNDFAADLDGNRNIVLLYTGAYKNDAYSPLLRITAPQMLPYIGYTDKTGKIIDSMYDGVLFLPSDPGSYYAFDKKQNWETYLKITLGIDSTVNAAALNKAVGENRSAIGLAEGKKYPVYISVPYIEYSKEFFGNINGVDIVPDNLAGRTAVVKWFIDRVITDFSAAGFENIELKGFYWHNESVPYASSSHEEALIMEFNKYARSLGFSTVWIPYYCAPGYERWRELGFTAATLQPGYAFIEYGAQSKKPATVSDTLDLAKKYGLGLEIEYSSLLLRSDNDAFGRLMTYIYEAQASGMTRSGLTMYYQGGGPGIIYTCSGTSVKTARGAYDFTYKYIKNDVEGLNDLLFGEKTAIGTYNDVLNEFFGYKIYNADGKPVTGAESFFGTGYTVVYTTPGNYSFAKTVTVKGDLSGDGKIEPIDYLICKKAVMRSIILTEAQKKAADVSGRNKLSSVDYLMLKKHVQKSYVIQ